jgi:hypothetical protein
MGFGGVRSTLDQDTQAEMVEVGVPKKNLGGKGFLELKTGQFKVY